MGFGVSRESRIAWSVMSPNGIEAASWVSAYRAKAARIASVVMSPNGIEAASASSPAISAAIESKSWR